MYFLNSLLPTPQTQLSAQINDEVLPVTIPNNASNFSWRFKLTDALQACNTVYKQSKCQLNTLIIGALLFAGSTIATVKLSQATKNGHNYKSVLNDYVGIDKSKPENNLWAWSNSYNTSPINRELYYKLNSLSAAEKRLINPYLTEGKDVNSINEPDIAGIEAILQKIQAFAKKLGIVMQPSYRYFSPDGHYNRCTPLYQPNAKQNFSQATQPATIITCTNGKAPNVEMTNQGDFWGWQDSLKSKQLPSLESTRALREVKFKLSCTENVTFTAPENSGKNASTITLNVDLTQPSILVPVDNIFVNGSLTASFLGDLQISQFEPNANSELEFNFTQTTLANAQQQALKLNHEFTKTFDTLFAELANMLKNNSLALTKNEIKELKTLIKARESLKAIFAGLVSSSVIAGVTGLITLLSLCVSSELKNKFITQLMQRIQKTGDEEIELISSAVDLGALV